MDKLYAKKITDCRTCVLLHDMAHFCAADPENLGPIELFDFLRDGGIHPDCPLPDFKAMVTESEHARLLQKLETIATLAQTALDNGASKRDDVMKVIASEARKGE